MHRRSSLMSTVRARGDNKNARTRTPDVSRTARASNSRFGKSGRENDLDACFFLLQRVDIEVHRLTKSRSAASLVRACRLVRLRMYSILFSLCVCVGCYIDNIYMYVRGALLVFLL